MAVTVTLSLTVNITSDDPRGMSIKRGHNLNRWENDRESGKKKNKQVGCHGTSILPIRPRDFSFNLPLLLVSASTDVVSIPSQLGRDG